MLIQDTDKAEQRLSQYGLEGILIDDWYSNKCLLMSGLTHNKLIER